MIHLICLIFSILNLVSSQPCLSEKYLNLKISGPSELLQQCKKRLILCRFNLLNRSNKNRYSNGKT